MYAIELMNWLDVHLVERGASEQTMQRFERLRGYNLIPRGRENAAVRLSDKQIASAVLGFGHVLPGYAGHASLIWGGLRPVGGAIASYRGAGHLLEAVTVLIGEEHAYKELKSLTLSTERDFGDDKYFATLKYVDDGATKTVSFVSEHALRLQQEGAEQTYDHDNLTALSAHRRSFGPNFFRELSSTAALSRHLNHPLKKTDWKEYETEEQKEAFFKRLGATPQSRFLNLGVDTQVTWPKQPTRVNFEGRYLVLFPKTKDHSHTICIDLSAERMTSEDARTFINRFLSLLSWCDDRYAILREGWSGNPVPMHVQRRNIASATSDSWVFRRQLPVDQELLQRLAYYREGANAHEAGSSTYEVLSFFKAFEQRQRSRKGQLNLTKQWISQSFEAATDHLPTEIMDQFYQDRGEIEVADYILDNCRVATAHASETHPSDADASLELRRLSSAANILRALARYYIKNNLGFSDDWFEDP